MIKLNTVTLEATRESIPASIRGLDNETLRNLQSELNPVPDDLTDLEWWPEVVTVQTITSLQKFGDEILSANEDKTVSVSFEVLDKTAEEIAADLVSLKAIKKSELDNAFYYASERPIVDTGLGFEVHGGYTDLADFTVGADLGLTVIRAADNSMHTVTSDEFAAVIMAIKLRGFAIKGNKWELADAITAATNQAELDAIDINEGW